MIDTYRKYKEQLNYLIFGGLTTVVNIGVYFACFQVLNISNVTSNVLAWIGSVLFAYLTNRAWVFESKTETINEMFYELVKFIGCRGVTGAIDIAIMYVAVDGLGIDGMVMKIISNILVIICNYFASKWFIFK